MYFLASVWSTNFVPYASDVGKEKYKALSTNTLKLYFGQYLAYIHRGVPQVTSQICDILSQSPVRTKYYQKQWLCDRVFYICKVKFVCTGI